MRFLSITVLLLLSLATSLVASLQDKSAMVYYGEDISYPMVGIHDYIIVQPELINVYSHGFKIYKNKMYAYVSINEIQENIKEYKYVDKSWIISENKDWGSKVLDIKNRDYQEFIFQRLIEPRMKEGFENFFFDTLDSYQIGLKNKKEKEQSREALVHFIKEFHIRYPKAKLIINRGFDIIDEVHEGIEAVLFESYYNGLGGDTGYKKVSEKDREWLDIYLDKIKAYGIDIISLEYLEADDIEKKAENIIKKIKERGMIPYVSHRELVIYGKSSKNAIKREILTLVDETNLDRLLQPAHQYGALPLEYMGYIQKLFSVDKGLPSIDSVRSYAGVIVWLETPYIQPKALLKWLNQVKALGIKIVFVDNFGGLQNSKYLKKFGLKYKSTRQQQIKILSQDEMIAYEVEPSLSTSNIQVKSKNIIKPLLVYRLENRKKSTLSAITSWGGYAIEESFMVELQGDNLWVIDPFKFFKEALHLKDLLVPDVTTENGKRFLFTHIDGDGIMNRVEGDQQSFSGEVILNKILKRYKIPHSVSVIGAEIDKDGLYPDISSKLTNIAKDMYRLENVEPVTHTFTHPFNWGMIIDDSLSQDFRLKVPNYDFSLEREISQSLRDINRDLLDNKKRKAKTVFWSGDCAPRVNALEHVYKNNLLNINGGDTSITIDKPWLSYIAPLGVKRGDYYQIYTGAQNENVFTNDWLGPFWGFKKVVQTFKLTNSPRRFKPIDIYYHIYSGSKAASLKALEYVFDWALEQDVMPIFTSEYIPKVEDFYEVSMANSGDDWLVDGMDSLKTVRVEVKNATINLKKSKTVIGVKHFENHTYISLDNSKNHYIAMNEDNDYMTESYIISSNAKVVKFVNNAKSKRVVFQGHTDLKVDLHLQRGCKIYSKPKVNSVKQSRGTIKLFYKGTKGAVIDIKCK